MSITVVLADDHVVVRQGLRAYLDAEPDIHVVGEASTGQEAVEHVAALKPDIAILDITMPDLNGIEAARKLHDEHPSTNVIILSMHSTNEHLFRGLSAGAHGFVSKSSAGEELVEAVRAVHAGHRYLNQNASDQLIEDYVHRRNAAETDSPLHELTDREVEILEHLCNGKTTEEISRRLALSTTTINTYRSRLMRKLDIHNLPSLVKFALRHGLTDLD